MKIVVNARFLTQPLSGVQRYGIECSRQIKKKYPDVLFVCPPNIMHSQIADELQAKVIGKKTGHLWEQIDLPWYLAKNNYPPLLCLANTAPLFYNNNYITIHDLAFYHYPEWNSKKFSTWYNILIPRLIYKCRHIFTVSETIKNELIKNYSINSNKISITYNGISGSMLAEKTDNVLKEKIILSVGSFNTRKNHQNLITAFVQSKIKETYQLVIIGDKNKVFRESKIDESVLLNNNITIYNGFTERELMNMYQKAEAVVSLSLYEGFGIPLLEGLFYNCKIICSDIPVYRELYEGHACFCNPTDIGGVSDALNNIANLQYPSSIEGYQSLFKRFNYERSAQTIMDQII
jgi:glycosyltransferase involved in cell wall biosynthesis